jgi:hypothetical protein
MSRRYKQVDVGDMISRLRQMITATPGYASFLLDVARHIEYEDQVLERYRELESANNQDLIQRIADAEAQVTRAVIIFEALEDATGKMDFSEIEMHVISYLLDNGPSAA